MSPTCALIDSGILM